MQPYLTIVLCAYHMASMSELKIFCHLVEECFLILFFLFFFFQGIFIKETREQKVCTAEI